MNETLKEVTETWMQLERKTLEQRKEADNFYEKNLMGLIREDYVIRNKKKVFESVNYLVVSVGTSYEPIVLNISLLTPGKILFLFTEKTEETLDKIVELCSLKPTQYQKRKVSEVNPLDIYKEIKRSYLLWNKPEKMYIDFTGGTKAMSAAAAMAGALINIQLIYVGTIDYLVDFRKPNPGSEELYYIENPLVIFGDLEIEKTMVLFGELNYAGAAEKLEYLKDNIPDPNIRQQLNFSYLLAKAYEKWDALDFANAYEYMKKLTTEIYRDRIHSDFLLMDYYERLKEQEKKLELLKTIPGLIKEKKNVDILLNKNQIFALMFTMHQNAVNRIKQEKYDMATLLLYRLLEMIEQRRLAKYNLYVSNMDYYRFVPNQKRMPEYLELNEKDRMETLKTSVANIKRNLFGKPGGAYLPEQVSLLEGYIILFAFHDPITAMKDVNDIAILKRIRAMVFLRNNSIFAHGLGPVAKSDFDKFHIFVEEMFKKSCDVEKVKYDDNITCMRFVDPSSSVNYNIQMGE